MTFESRAMTDVLTSCVLNLWQKILWCVTIVERRGLPPVTSAEARVRKACLATLTLPTESSHMGPFFKLTMVSRRWCVWYEGVSSYPLSLERSMTPSELRGRTRVSKWHICLTGAGAEERCAVPTKSDQSRDLILYMYSDDGLNTDEVWWGDEHASKRQSKKQRAKVCTAKTRLYEWMRWQEQRI